MKIKIGNLALLDILKMMVPIAPKSCKTLELECVKIVADLGGGEFTSANLTETLVIQTPDVTVIETGACLVDLRKLLRAVRYISGPLELVADGKTITVNRAIRLLAASLEDYPSWKEFPGTEPQRASAESLRDAILSVEHAISSDDARPVLTGVLFRWTNGGFGVVASDGFRIATHNAPASEIALTEILPGDAACHLARWAQGTVEIRRTDEKYQNLYSWEHAGKGWQGHLSLRANMITGKYPPYENIIPTKFPASFQIDRKALIQHIEALMEMFIFDGYTAVKCILLDGAVLITVRNDEDRYDKIIPAETVGAMQFVVNPYLLLPALRSIKSSRILLKLRSPSAPIVIEPVIDVESRIIMPMHDGDPLSEREIADVVSTLE